MKWKPALVLLLAAALAASEAAWSGTVESGTSNKAGEDTSSVMSGFDQMAVSPSLESAGQSVGTGSSGTEVHAGAPFGNQGQQESEQGGLGQFNPGGPGPAPTPSPGPGQNAPGKPGKGTPKKQSKSDSGKKPAPQLDLSQVINGTWRVEFSNGFVTKVRV